MEKLIKSKIEEKLQEFFKNIGLNNNINEYKEILYS